LTARPRRDVWFATDAVDDEPRVRPFALSLAGATTPQARRHVVCITHLQSQRGSQIASECRAAWRENGLLRIRVGSVVVERWVVVAARK